VVQRIVGANSVTLLEVLAGVAVGGFIVTRLHGRFEIWKWSIVMLVVAVLISVIRP
jgi:hypothetical protein